MIWISYENILGTLSPTMRHDDDSDVKNESCILYCKLIEDNDTYARHVKKGGEIARSNNEKRSLPVRPQL